MRGVELVRIAELGHRLGPRPPPNIAHQFRGTSSGNWCAMLGGGLLIVLHLRSHTF